MHVVLLSVIVVLLAVSGCARQQEKKLSAPNDFKIQEIRVAESLPVQITF